MGVKPLIGRVFTEAEDLNGAQVAVISYGLWQRRYGGSPDVLGRTISVSDIPYEVIGVLPREFYFLPAREIDLWIPASFPAWMRKAFGWHDEQVVARLKAGVTAQARNLVADGLHELAAHGLIADAEDAAARVRAAKDLADALDGAEFVQDMRIKGVQVIELQVGEF